MSKEKTGRNAPCWCGSGKKYKKCHLLREQEEPIHLWQIEKEFKRVLSRRQCLAPSAWTNDCSTQISRAHTVPRSGSLARIARDGHVYGFRGSVMDLENTGGVIEPRLVGINKASTFTGFCSGHDRSIFSPVENADFRGTLEQCFLLCYRGLVREIFEKQAMASLMPLNRKMDRGKSIDQQHAIQANMDDVETGYSLAAADDKYLKHIYDDTLVTRSYHRARAYFIELAEPPPVMCSSALCPEEDFEGNEMQDLDDYDRVPHSISLTSFHGGKHGAVVLSWIDEHDPVCIPFVKSLHRIRDSALTSALIKLLFMPVGNVYIQPQWWEALSSVSREGLLARIHVSTHPLVPVPQGFLTYDGLRFDPWAVIDRRCVGFEL